MDEVKLSVVIGVPARPVEFESTFPALLELAGSMPGLLGLEAARVFPRADGSVAATYRTLDMYFDSYGTAILAGDSPQGRSFFDRLAEAGGRFTRLVSHVERHACAAHRSESPARLTLETASP